MNAHSETNKISRSPEKSSPEQNAKGRRGRPKGARTTSLTEVRRQAAAEKNRLKLELGNKIKELQQELHDLQKLYEEDTARLNEEIDHLKRREGNYQKALDTHLLDVADHLQKTLLHWGQRELEEAQIDKRGRGRPRKTLKY
ncbi:MAG: DNA-binding protein [Thiolinea sp.]